MESSFTTTLEATAPGPASAATAQQENFLYDIDGKFKYQVFDPTQHQFKLRK